MTVSEQLRRAIQESKETHYGIGLATGIDTRALDRFVTDEKHIRTETVDKLCDYFGLELAEKKTGTAVKQTGKRPATKRKRAKKRAE